MTTPATCTASWSRFPPRTREVQFDEKWAFVAKKEKNCDRADPADDHKGDTWDHVAFDAEAAWSSVSCPASGRRRMSWRWSRLQASHRGGVMDLITTDGYPAYEEAI